MGLPRACLALAILLGAVIAAAPAEAAGTTGSGGVLASPLEQGAGGGGLAPGGAGVAGAAGTEDGGAPVAAPAQEDTPTAPEGEEQPTEEQPVPDGEEQPAPDEEVVDPVDPGAPEEEIATDDGALGFLPSTGLETGALAALGLGLLMAGAALRPRRRVAAGRR